MGRGRRRRSTDADLSRARLAARGRRSRRSSREFPELLERAAREFAPHLLTYYLHDDVAARLHTYYNAERFLVDDERVKLARLALVAATRQVLANGLAVLGVSRARKDVMAKDYARKRPRRARESRLAHPMLMGMIIGLLLGIIISLAVALWLNRLSNPFVDKGKQIEPLPKIGATQPPPAARGREGRRAGRRKGEGRARQGQRRGAAKKAAKTDRPRFEFYQILPGDKEVTDKEIKAAKAAPPGPPRSRAEARLLAAHAQGVLRRDLLAAGRRLRLGARR